MNDLLSEDGPLPGIATRIPRHEAFAVASQDAGASVFDAWYLTGSTPDQDPRLVALENALFLSRLTTP